jgi:hypothetical protein
MSAQDAIKANYPVVEKYWAETTAFFTEAPTNWDHTIINAKAYDDLERVISYCCLCPM